MSSLLSPFLLFLSLWPVLFSELLSEPWRGLEGAELVTSPRSRSPGQLLLPCDTDIFV